MRAIERLAKDAFGPQVSVTACRPLDGRDVGGFYTEVHQHLLRCHLSGDTAPCTVIVKLRRPADDGRADPRYLRNDRAGLEFLTAIGSLAAPRFYAGDDDAGIVMMEDLGTGASVDSTLVGADPDAAHDALLAYARSLGRLHASTIGRADEFYEIRAALGPVDPLADRVTYGGAPVTATWSRLKEQLPQVPTTDGADSDITELVRLLADPGDYLALTNGDVCPQNCRLFGDHVRFLDFDGAAFRHAILDVAYLWFPFVDCPCRALLPIEIRNSLLAAYRAEMAVLDDASFYVGLTAACAAKAIQRASGWVSVQDTDATYGMGISKRGWLLSTIQTFLDCAAQSGTLLELAAWFARLSDLSRAQWPDAPESPLYPAFRAR